MSKPILHAEDLRKIYDHRLALDIPYLEFEEGGIHALIGPNGSGKTTLLRILGLLEEPTSGRLFFDGLHISLSSSAALAARRQMTLVMQAPVLFRTSVYRNVVYGLAVRGAPRKSRAGAVEEALNAVGLSGFESRRARKLSAGESQRVALARALVLEPRVLLLDEPTANVDRENVEVLESVLLNVNSRKGTTVIFTTHDLMLAHRLTRNVIRLADGTLGPLAE